MSKLLHEKRQRLVDVLERNGIDASTIPENSLFTEYGYQALRRNRDDYILSGRYIDWITEYDVTPWPEMVNVVEILAAWRDWRGL